MEQYNVQVEDGISLIDVFKLLLRKVKYLILAVLIGGVLGGAFGIFKTHNVDYYGTQIEFYVNPKKKDALVSGDSQYGVYGAYGEHVMDNMVRLLGSEIFAEMLILEGKTLPEKDTWVNASNADEVALALNDKIDAATPFVQNYEAQKAALDVMEEKLDELELALATAQAELTAEWVRLYTYKDPNIMKSTTFDESIYASLPPQDTTYADLHAIYQKRASVKDNLAQQEINVELKQKEVTTARLEMSTQVTEVMTAWRKTAKYKESLQKHLASLSYDYKSSNAKDESSSTFARSFIYVKISVLNDKKFAETLLTKVKELVPTYIEDNMAVPSGYVGTNCQAITTMDDILLTNPSYTVTTAIKYAVLLAVAAFVIACVIIVIIDRTDKRLRDPDDIKRTYNVPLLGVVPTIDTETPSNVSTEERTGENTEVK